MEEEKIILRYSQFVILRENSKKNDSQIIESANILFKQWKKEYKKNVKEQIKKCIHENKNKFGYINVDNLLKELEFI